MKLIILLLPLLAATTMGFEIRKPPVEATIEGRSVASIVVDIIYYIRDEMPCGFPALGLPPLAPLEIPNISYKFQLDTITIDLEMKNFVLDGLDNFDVITMKINPALGRMKFEMLWNNINLTTSYKIKIYSEKSVIFEREGNAKLAIKGLSVAGKSDFDLGLRGSNPLHMSTFFIYFNVATVESNITNLSPKPYMNKILNDIIEEWISIAINDYSEEIAQLISDNITRLVNDLIDGRTLKQIIADITGGSKDIRSLRADCKTSIKA